MAAFIKGGSYRTHDARRALNLDASLSADPNRAFPATHSFTWTQCVSTVGNISNITAIAIGESSNETIQFNCTQLSASSAALYIPANTLMLGHLRNFSVRFAVSFLAYQGPAEAVTREAVVSSLVFVVVARIPTANSEHNFTES